MCWTGDVTDTCHFIILLLHIFYWYLVLMTFKPCQRNLRIYYFNVCFNFNPQEIHSRRSISYTCNCFISCCLLYKMCKPNKSLTFQMIYMCPKFAFHIRIECFDLEFCCQLCLTSFCERDNQSDNHSMNVHLILVDVVASVVQVNEVSLTAIYDKRFCKSSKQNYVSLVEKTGNNCT